MDKQINLVSVFIVFPQEQKKMVSSSSSNSDIIYGCCGALAILAGGLGVKMSQFRVAGSPGENDPNSALNKWYLHNQLVAEWNATLIPLFLAANVAGVNDRAATAVIVVATLGRYGFLLKLIAPRNKQVLIGAPCHLPTYVACVYLGIRLVFRKCKIM